jgi:Ca2+-binding EF-hand superfamily protein
MSEKVLNDSSRFGPSERELRHEFKRVDRNADGRIDLAEFEELLEGLGADMTHEVMTIGFNEVDIDKDGLIDVREFCEWWLSD